MDAFDLKRNLEGGERATILGTWIIDQGECNTLQGKRKKKKKNTENKTEGKKTKTFQPKVCFELAAAGRKMLGLLLGRKSQVIPKS